MTDDNFETLFDDDGNDIYVDGDGAVNNPSETGVRSLEDFQALVEYHIAVMTSTRNSQKVRVESALWLGESGDTDAIRPLISVYKRDKKHPNVQKAAAYALGMFKALDAAIQREPHEMVEDALGHPENVHIIQTLTDIAVLDKRGSRANRRRWLRMIFILSLLLIALVVAYALIPTGSLRQALTPPTPTPSPTIDPNAPTPTPTFTPSETPTITPTATSTPGIPPEEVRRIQSDLLTYIGLAATTRDFLDGLSTAWISMSQNSTPANVTAVCNTQVPTIPDDYVLPEGYAALNPSLGQATDYINTGLSLVRNGWSYLRDSCTQGMNVERINTGLSIVRTAQDSFAEADRLLSER